MPKDASVIARELAPEFESEDVLNLLNHTVYLKMTIDGAPSRPFSALTLNPDQDVALR